jgi:hypothetical protein
MAIDPGGAFGPREGQTIDTAVDLQRRVSALEAAVYGKNDEAPVPPGAFWEGEARRYSENSDYWRSRYEALSRILLGTGTPFAFNRQAFWAEPSVKRGHTIDVITRKDGVERRYQADWIKEVARELMGDGPTREAGLEIGSNASTAGANQLRTSPASFGAGGGGKSPGDACVQGPLAIYDLHGRVRSIEEMDEVMQPAKGD